MRSVFFRLLAIGPVLACSLCIVCSACAEDEDTKTKTGAKSEAKSEKRLDPAAVVAERFVRSFIEQHDVDAAMKCVSSPFYRIDGSVQANLKRLDSPEKTRQHLLRVIAEDPAVRRHPECRLGTDLTEDLRSVFKDDHMKVMTLDMKGRWEKAGLFGPQDRAFTVKSKYFSVMVIVAQKNAKWQVTGYAIHYAR